MVFHDRETETHTPKKIAIFASGNGSNAENIIRYFRDRDGESHNSAEVALVVCNRANAGVLERASRLGVPAAVIERNRFNDPVEMGRLLDNYAIDIVVLAGFLLMVPSFIIHRYEGRIINIHPSLLPKFGGKGMFGRHVHEAVIAAGETETGITIHHVSEGCDEGGVIFQASVAVEPTDTPESVEAKIHDLERRHFARVIDLTLVNSEK